MTDSLEQHLSEIRRDIHRHPELSFRETRTAEVVSRELERLGITHETGVAGTGVVGEIPGRAQDTVVALRADIDALPIQEETGLPFSSVNEGVMHACGHDGHLTMLIGAAELLVRDPKPPVTVRLIFQPAEETGAGARAMMEQGVLEGVSLIFGGHIDMHYDAGVIIVSAGPMNASTDTFHITVNGKAAHAARPQEGVDAVAIGSSIVSMLQTLVSREVNPAHAAVVTVGRFEAGTAANVLAETAVLDGTIRTQLPEVRDHLKTRVRQIAEGTARVHRAGVDLVIEEGTPPLINSAPMAQLARRAAILTVGEGAVTELETANMGGEDFAFYLEEREGCYVRFGGRTPGTRGTPAHSPDFRFDERVLVTGATFFRNIVYQAGELLLKQ